MSPEIQHADGHGKERLAPESPVESVHTAEPAGIIIPTPAGLVVTAPGPAPTAQPAVDIADNPQSLEAAIREHEKWVLNPSTGKRLDLSTATLSRSTLAGVSWRNRELSEANFGSADIGGLDFTDADLTDADLSECPSLEPDQFAGAVLKRAKLPETFEISQLAATDEMSRNCGNYFLTTLAACAYVLLTVLSTTDAALIADSSSSTLPILQTSVSITAFYFWAPVVLLVVYVFYLLNMKALWKTMASLPAIFPNGRNIENATYPWIVNGLTRYFGKRLKNTRTPGGYVIAAGVALLAYGTVPTTMAAVWLRTIRQHVVVPPHAFYVQLYQLTAVFTAAAVCIGIAGLRNVVTTLSRSNNPATERARWVAATAWQALILGLGIVTSILFINISTAVQNGKLNLVVFTQASICHPFDVDGADLSTRPEDWEGSTKEDYEAIAGANLRDQDLRRMNGELAFFVHADLRGCNLSDADLRYADLRGALLRPSEDPKLPAAVLTGAKLDGAKLDYCDLRRTNLDDVDFFGASLQGAYMVGATVDGGTNFLDDDMRGADLRRVHGLTVKQLSYTFGDDTTKLDRGMRPTGPHWPHKLTDAQLIAMRGF